MPGSTSTEKSLNIHICKHYWGENHNKRSVTRSFENMANFEFLGNKVTFQNFIEADINIRLNQKNARYLSFQNILFSRLLPKNAENETHKTILCLLFCADVKHGFVH